MLHHTQRARKRNLDLIQSWIKGFDKDKINRIKLERKIQLVLGASKNKAKEYVDVILGDVINTT